jgi:hypothetical protein
VKKLIAALVVLFQISSPAISSAADVPLLTWERGREQHVVLASKGDLNLTVTLEGEAGNLKNFSASNENAQGMRVYTTQIPDDFPLGGYLIRVTRNSEMGTTLAGVTIVEAQTVTPAGSLRELSFLLGLLTFFTAAFGVMRSRRYSQLSVPEYGAVFLENNGNNSVNQSGKMKIVDRVLSLRFTAVAQMNNSLLKFLIIRNAGLLAALSIRVLTFLPFISVAVGAIVGLSVVDAVDLYTASAGLLLLLFAISIFDVYSGILGFIALGGVHVILGELSSIRDIALVLILALTSVLAPLLSDFMSRSFVIDFGDNVRTTLRFKELLQAFFVFAISGAIYYFGFLLFDSLIYSQAGIANSLAPVILGLSVLNASINLVANRKLLESGAPPRNVARLLSPLAAFLIHVGIFYFLFSWIDRIDISIYASSLLAAPYYLLVLKLERGIGKPSGKRLILIEALAMAMLVGFIYNQVQDQPVLGDSRTTILLMFLGVVTTAHAAYCLAKSSNEVEEEISV